MTSLIETTIGVSLYVGKREYGFRRWAAVPRVGDRVVVIVNDRHVQLRVVDVIWGIMKTSRVAVMLESAPPSSPASDDLAWRDMDSAPRDGRDIETNAGIVHWDAEHGYFTGPDAARRTLHRWRPASEGEK